MLDSSEITSIRTQALMDGDPESETDPVVDAALDMAQSTFVEAADKTCEIAESA